MKNLKVLLLFMPFLFFGINTYGQDPFQFDGDAAFYNFKSLDFKNSSGLTDGTRIIRYSGGSLRIQYNINALNFDAVNNQPIHIRNSNDEIPLKLHPAGSSYFNGGNVGFGITSPQDKVHIVAGTNAGLLRALTIENDDATNGSTAVGIGFIASGGTQKKGLIAFQRTTGNGIGDFIFALNNINDGSDASLADEVMRITKNGFVGIGVINPDSKLVVDGKIRSEEIKVEIINGPDYVFEDDYELRTLQNTKEFITKNKHLPEIPTAKEMEAKGVNLGEMNMLLLKKIEEMTLYLIEQNQNLQNANQEIRALKKKFENLENK